MSSSSRRRMAMLARHLSPASVAADLPDQGAIPVLDMDPYPDGRNRLVHKVPPPGEGRPFLSHYSDFGTVARGDPQISSLTGDAAAAAGLTEATWSLDVYADPFVEPPHVKVPATITNSVKLDLAGLRALGEKYGVVKMVKAMQCLNIDGPLGQGLWEGVPLAMVLRQCGKVENVRRINFWGFHNNDPKQVFRSSVSYLEAMEPVFGEPPVFLAYALNGEPLPVERGGPVRMIVPAGHGFKNVKWLQHITVTNDYRTSDTYASQDDIGNDPHSNLKTYTTVEGQRSAPWVVKRGEAVVLNGTAMNGRTPISHIEYWVRKVEDFKGPRLSDDSPEILSAPWQRCELPPPPSDWQALLPGDTKPAEVFACVGEHKRWPLPYMYVSWSTLITDLMPGHYELRARTVDLNGHAQPEPRRIQKNGKNGIGMKKVTVE